MSVSVLTTIRDHLKTDAALLAYWQAHYSKDAMHYVGYKRTPKTREFEKNALRLAGTFSRKALGIATASTFGSVTIGRGYPCH